MKRKDLEVLEYIIIKPIIEQLLLSEIRASELLTEINFKAFTFPCK